MEMDKMPEILRVMEVAKWLRLPKSTAYLMVKNGTIPSFKIGRQVRVRKADVLKIITGQVS